MPVGMLQTLQGVTKEQYDQVNEKMFGQSPPPADKAPDGLIVHSAGPTQGGWYIYDIWESPEHFQRFATEKLGPAMAATGAGGGAQPQPQFFPIETLVKGPAL